MDRFIYSERERLAEEYEKWVNQPLKDGSKIKDCPFSVISFMCSKGYRKINENEVVISKEEYKRLKRVETEKDRLYEMKLDLENQLIEKGWTDYEGADEIEKRVSKETAEKILERGKYCMPSG